MFNGIVETVGTISQIVETTTSLSGPENAAQDCLTITLKPQMLFDDLKIGDSVAVNGVCLTVTTQNNGELSFSVVPETLRRTNLGQLVKGSQVNLERSMPAGGRIGGHFVQGHVDFCGEILSITQDGTSALLVKISNPVEYAHYIVNKGYIGLDGMSITVIESQPAWFTVTFIPHTQAVTVVKHYTVGTAINIEVDILGKYIEKILGGLNHESRRAG